jgi:hypothetical protein
MPVWLESLLEVLAEKLYLPNADKIRDWFIKSPLLVALLNIIPILGAIMTYGMVLEQIKILIFLFADILMLALLPIYPIYKLLTAIDVFLLTRKLKNGKEISNMEFF